MLLLVLSALSTTSGHEVPDNRIGRLGKLLTICDPSARPSVSNPWHLDCILQHVEFPTALDRPASGLLLDLGHLRGMVLLLSRSGRIYSMSLRVRIGTRTISSNEWRSGYSGCNTV